MFSQYNNLNNTIQSNISQEQLYRCELIYIQACGCVCSQCTERIRYITDELDKLQRKPIKDNIVNNFKKIKTKKECCICLTCDSDSESYILPCKHVLHVECLNDWFKYNHTCPICRKDFNEMDNICGCNDDSEGGGAAYVGDMGDVGDVGDET